MITIKRLFNGSLYIYQKIILIFVVLILPAYIIGFNINKLRTSYVKYQLLSSMKSKIYFYTSIFDAQIRQVKMQQFELLYNDDLQNASLLTSLKTYDDVKLLDNLSKRLRTIKNSSSFVKNVGIYIKSLNKTVSTNGGITNTPNKEYEIVKRYYEDGFYGTSAYCTPEGNVYLLETLPYPKVSHVRNVFYSVYVEISKENMEKMLTEMSEYKGTGLFIVDKSLKTIIESGSNSEDVKTILKGLDDDIVTGSIERRIKINDKNYWVITGEFDTLDMQVYSYIPESQLIGLLMKYNIWFIILSFLSLAVVIIFAFATNWMIHKPFNEFVKTINEIKLGNMNKVQISNNRNDEFGYIFSNFNNMVTRLNNSIQEVYGQKIIAQQLELKQLQSQINPHFLYNCFFNIYNMCKCEDYEMVALLTQKLGSYYQFITRNGSDEVELRFEYGHARDYMEIQSIRFSNVINVEMAEIPVEYRNIIVPRIILQPVIENAFEHAFKNRAQGGNIYINNDCRPESLRFIVEDDGDGISDDELELLQEKLANPLNCKEKTGIINVSRRIQLKFGRDSGLYVSRSLYGGLRFDLLIFYKRFEEGVASV